MDSHLNGNSKSWMKEKYLYSKTGNGDIYRYKKDGRSFLLDKVSKRVPKGDIKRRDIKSILEKEGIDGPVLGTRVYETYRVGKEGLMTKDGHLTVKVDSIREKTFEPQNNPNLEPIVEKYATEYKLNAIPLEDGSHAYKLKTFKSNLAAGDNKRGFSSSRYKEAVGGGRWISPNSDEDVTHLNILQSTLLHNQKVPQEIDNTPRRVNLNPRVEKIETGFKKLLTPILKGRLTPSSKPVSLKDEFPELYDHYKEDLISNYGRMVDKNTLEIETHGSVITFTRNSKNKMFQASKMQKLISDQTGGIMNAFHKLIENQSGNKFAMKADIYDNYVWKSNKWTATNDMTIRIMLMKDMQIGPMQVNPKTNVELLVLPISGSRFLVKLNKIGRLQTQKGDKDFDEYIYLDSEHLEAPSMAKLKTFEDADRNMRIHYLDNIRFNAEMIHRPKDVNESADRLIGDVSAFGFMANNIEPNTPVRVAQFGAIAGISGLGYAIAQDELKNRK